MDDELTADLARDLDGSFEALVLAHQDRLYTIALRILGRAHDAEEIAQDAFVRAYRALASYEPTRVRELQLRPWLTTIVVNLARNRLARGRIGRDLSLDAPSSNGSTLADALAVVDGEARPEDAALRAESARDLAALLAALPERYRVPIVLRHVDGLSFAEMAAALDRPEGTLKSQVHRGLALLHSALVAEPSLASQELTA